MCVLRGGGRGLGLFGATQSAPGPLTLKSFGQAENHYLLILTPAPYVYRSLAFLCYFGLCINRKTYTSQRSLSTLTISFKQAFDVVSQEELTSGGS